MGDLGMQVQNKYAYVGNFKNNFWKIWTKSDKLIRLEFKEIKWKNNKASPGTAYIPTEVEHLANIITHGIWIVPAILAASHLVQRAKTSSQLLAAWVYGSALTLLFFVSTIFHSVFYCSRNRGLKNAMHRCDRAMIYVFIAGSYFPWLQLEQTPPDVIFASLQWLIWLLALLGITYQQLYHERFKCFETFLYIVMGLGPSLVVIMSGHQFGGMSELKLGGFLYIVGICFFKADGLIPFAHAIWHLFVVIAAGVHYFAILKHLFPTHVPIT